MNQDENLDNIVQQMSEKFTCIICMEIATQPMLVPCCNHIVCFSCIQKWLDDNQTCPFCRQCLSKDNLVNIKWADGIRKLLPIMKNQIDSHFLCNKHSKKSEFYCNDCAKLICSDCLYETFSKLSTEHLNHRIIPILDYIQIIKRDIIKESHKLMSVLSNIINLSEKIRLSICSISLQKISIAHQMQAQYDKIVQNFQHAYFSSHQTIQQQLFHLQFLKKQISNLNPEQIITLDSSSLITKPLQIMTNTITPRTIEIRFVISDLKSAVSSYKANAFFYTPPFIVDGNLFSMKVFPRGNANAAGSFLSIFIELLQGSQNQRMYTYSLSVKKKTGRPVMRQYSSEFELHKSWGWNKVLSISDLLGDEYLDESGSLHIQLGMKASSYIQITRDIQWAIEELSIPDEEELETLQATNTHVIDS